MSQKIKMTKDTVPEGFTMGLALVDAIPVLFFGINCILLGGLFENAVFTLGALVCFVSGAVKVLWKIIVVLKKKNVWPMFLQMRILMPAGFVIMLLALIFGKTGMSAAQLWAEMTVMPVPVFFMLGILGMVMMIIFAARLDGSDTRSNWIEQLTNGLSQIAFFVGILLMYS